MIRRRDAMKGVIGAALLWAATTHGAAAQSSADRAVEAADVAAAFFPNFHAARVHEFRRIALR